MGQSVPPQGQKRSPPQEPVEGKKHCVYHHMVQQRKTPTGHNIGHGANPNTNPKEQPRVSKLGAVHIVSKKETPAVGTDCVCGCVGDGLVKVPVVASSGTPLSRKYR